MSENCAVEKKATTREERAKYIRAAILAAVGGAGIGAIIRSRKANKVRAKEENPENARNTIIVPIKKTKFLEELPTPRELAESRGEQLGQASNGDAGKPSDAATAAEDVSAVTSGSEALTQEQIAAKKKEIIGNGRKFNFFGKRAAAKTAQAGEAKKKDLKSDDEKDKGDNGEKKEDDGRTLFRDQDGKFVSPTDPVAVAQSEKKAFPIENFFAPFIHPIDTIGSNAGAIFDKPVLGTVGALGSIYLAAKISDAINERRRAKAKERLEKARAEYIGILEGEEKKAQAGIDMRTTPGAVLGTAFFVPMAAAALVTSKIIENRKIEKKKQKEMSDSYPDDPIILYKTSEAKEISMSPEAMIAMIMVKRAMIEDIERNHFMSKSAQLILPQPMVGDGGIANTVSNAWDSLNSATRESAMDDAFKYLLDDKNSDQVLNLVKAYGPGGTQKQRDAAYASIASGIGTIGNWWKGNDKFWKDSGFMSALMADPRMNDMLASRFNNNDKYIAYRNSIIDHELGKTFKQGGILHSIISWIMKNTGIGAYMFNNRLNDTLAQFGSKSQSASPAQVQNANPQVQKAQTTTIPKANGKGGLIIAR